MAIERGKKPDHKHLLPTHLSTAGTEGKRRRLNKDAKPKDLQEGFVARREALDGAKDLEEILRDEWKTKTGEDAPENRNLSLDVIDEFRIQTRRAQSLRAAVKAATKPTERSRLLALYSAKREEVKKSFETRGPSFERAYRNWMRERVKFYDFLSKRNELVKTKALLNRPGFESISSVKDMTRAHVEDAAATTPIADDLDDLQEEVLESLATIYGEKSEEYTTAARDFETHASQGELKGNKPELQGKIDRVGEETQVLWQENPMVRYFYGQKETEDIIKGYAEGKDVMETQSVIRTLNTLWQWEQDHANTTIGGILVGPPGAGKTTLVRHYLDRLGRGYVYIDLSEDVTRYMLFGSKNIEFKNPRDQHTQLIADLKEMDEDQIKAFVTNNSSKIAETLHLSGDEADAVMVGNLMHEIEQVQNDPVLAKQLDAEIVHIRKKLQAMAETMKQKDLAYNLLTLVKKNGWRDGVVLSALRNNQSIIYDEFNKNKNWSSIFSLITAKPGDKWYFADNDEWIDIPKDWRQYFTANIGKKHGVYDIPEALASRAEGKVVEINYPPRSEEISVALASLANNEGDFLRSTDDLAKLVILINEVFPAIRKYTLDKRSIVPISYRTIRNLGEKLVHIRDPKTGELVYQPTGKTFDEASYEVLIGTYALYEDKTTAKEIAGYAASGGLMLGPEVKERMEKLIGAADFKRYEDALKDNKKAFNDILKIIQGLSTEKFMREMTPPESVGTQA